MTDQNSSIPAQSSTSSTSEGSSLVLPDQILPTNLFVLAVNGPVTFPTLLSPMLISSPSQIAMIEEVISRHRLFGLVLTREAEGDVAQVDPERAKLADLYSIGVVAKVIKRLKMPDGSINVLIHAIKRFRIKKALSEHPYLVVESEYLDEQTEKSTELDALTRSVVAHVKKLSETNPFFTEEMRMAMVNAPGPGAVADLVGFALSLPKAQAQEFLETVSVKGRFEKLLHHLRREQDVADLQRKINSDVNSKISKLQREFFLREQMKSIRRELGEEEDGKEKSAKDFHARIEAAKMPPDVLKVAMQELEKFESISENSPEYNIARTYLETLCDLPWSKESTDRLNLGEAQELLDAEHFGLDKVKERILEFLAVRKLKNDPKGSIICLVGPPGVGKTSIGKSIAQTMGRNFYRFSLGGMRDEAEIKGHRRTYVGAMPGKLIQAVKRAGTKNAVIMLDEIDKLASHYHGDPASALLEVLDPEQNSSFVDHYLDVPFDLSKVLFVTTANNISTIPDALLDRMEVIEIPGYTLEEKEEIATRYVIPKELAAHGIKPSQLKIERAALKRIMTDYAREPGVRTLQQLVGRIARKAAIQIVKLHSKSSKRKDPILVTEAELPKWLGPKRFFNEMAERITAPGVVVGLAWTSMGGDILFIEATHLPGTGQLKLTGKMGDVMSESAAIAWTYVKKKLSLEPQDGSPLLLKNSKTPARDRKFYSEHDFHLHIPAGAIPKDGPSAGVTMAAALYSLMTGRKARQRVAMTGELSLIGKVLPVGGIKEKILAAKRAGITTLVLPKLNQKDLDEVPEYALRGMTIHWASRVEEVFDWVLQPAVGSTSKAVGTRRVIKSGKKAIRSRTAVTYRNQTHK